MEGGGRFLNRPYGEGYRCQTAPRCGCWFGLCCGTVNARSRGRAVLRTTRGCGLPRRFAPRNDAVIFGWSFFFSMPSASAGGSLPRPYRGTNVGNGHDRSAGYARNDHPAPAQRHTAPPLTVGAFPAVCDPIRRAENSDQSRRPNGVIQPPGYQNELAPGPAGKL